MKNEELGFGRIFLQGIAEQSPAKKTGLSTAIPQPACGRLAGFPLQSRMHGRAIIL
jgi:hypothetical protein